jgi:uncharacterized protein YjiS (DUF1127 family)
MPAITALAVSAAAPFVRALAALGARAERGLKRRAKWMQNRRDAVRLADLDARMLADIGLSRGDLRDAYAEPLWRDPTDILARRAAERRVGRQRATLNCVKAVRPPTPLVAAPPVRCYPPLNRPARYLV